MRFKALLPLFCILLLSNALEQETNSIYYGDTPQNFLALPQTRLRVRRDDKTTKSFDVDNIDQVPTFPSDVINEEPDILDSEHTYYNMSIMPNVNITKYYVNLADWINQTGAVGASQHDHLKVSYRKAAGVQIGFEFPFYGHKITNLTIATGGFCYVGDQTHSWLAATQYIAPLMANFDTVEKNSAIMYGGDKEKFVVEWSKVTLRDNRKGGPFTFQVALFKNGDIWFVYKDVPISPQNISDTQHPCKLGISDAYLYNHKSVANEKSNSGGKRVIHEYHRISIQPEKILSNMVIILRALPTCLNFNSCEACSKSNLKYFHCSWCNPKQTDPEKAFCSDQFGLNRRRQEWVEGNCADEKKSYYCNNNELNGTATTLISNLTNNDASSTPPSTASSTTTPKTTVKLPHPDKVISLEHGEKIINPIKSSELSRKDGPPSGKEGGSGIAFFTLLGILAVSCSIWVLYAFYNPHTTSGQLLIKYRPSKWQIPSSHVRYSASVHM